METSKFEALHQELQNADFPDMHLKVGQPLIVQSLTLVDADPFTVSYIGAHGRQSFLITLPRVGDQAMWITPGSRFKFRVVHGMYAYAFTARILNVQSKPYPYAHFTLPESVKYRQIRQSLRLETRLPVEIRRANGTQTLAILRDISEQGARLELTGLLDAIGAEIALTIPIVLPDDVAAIPVTATIRNCSDLERSMSAGRFHYGVSFTSLAPEHGQRLRHFIEHLLVEQLA